jgi:hypothetical protein
MKPKSIVEGLISWIVALVLPVVMFFIIFYCFGNRGLQGWIDSLFIPGIVVLLINGQLFIHRMGTFDVLFYGFYRLFESWRNPVDKKYDNAGDYHLAMDAKRQKNKPYYLPFIVVSGLAFDCFLGFTFDLRTR